MRKPDNFKQWRKLLNQTWAQMGGEVEAAINFHCPRETPRILWKLHDRARRIRLQMRACADSFEPAYCEAIVEAVFRKAKP